MFAGGCNSRGTPQQPDSAGPTCCAGRLLPLVLCCRTILHIVNQQQPMLHPGLDKQVLPCERAYIPWQVGSMQDSEPVALVLFGVRHALGSSSLGRRRSNFA